MDERFGDDELDGRLFGEGQPCFGCAPDHPAGFRLRFTRDGENAVATRFVPDLRHQGPPGLVHGGLVATLADEIAAWTVVAVLGKFGFTADLAVKLRAPVRVGVPVEGRGELGRAGSRTARVEVALRQGEATVATAEVGFALLDEAGATRLLGTSLPEAWRRFAR